MSKQFIVDRHTTPGTPALDPVAIPKVPVYDTMEDVTADLANLSAGQIVATKDTGSELSQPVDVVEEGNLHAVTSNAVAVEIAKLKAKYITISGTSDSNGNMRILNLPANTIPILFTADRASTDANYNIFYSSTVQDYYMHISNFVTGACIANASIIGRVYYLEFSE